jgi:molybdopterin-guanine dinucleotide biosynthesis protein A
MELERSEVAALVLAGGGARRFGSDKTRAVLLGRTVLEHTLDAVRSVAGEVRVVGPWSPEGVERCDEPLPRQGPAAALAFGMDHVAAEVVLVVGADHPLLVPELLMLLADRLRDGAADAVVPTREGRDEPLVACYRRAVGASAASLVAAGERSLRAVLAAVPVDRVSEADWRAADPQGRSFLDVDTPQELERARRLLSSRAGPG